MLDNQTIAAVATPRGTGGLSVIRVSGIEAFTICDRVFRNPSGKMLQAAETHTIVYGHIVDGGKTVDEVLASVMKAPHTFTGENTVEISCHGGITVTDAVLSAVLKNGAVLAGPGEFTKRAFLNGRLDLSQAEAVIDVINSDSALALESANLQLEGRLSGEIASVRDDLLNRIAQLNAAADFPEEDIDELGIGELRSSLVLSKERLEGLLASSGRGKLIRDGINTAIIGKPNVGKSSLLNALAEEKRAIVTDIAGTTRDVIEERISIGPVCLNVFDTAGIRHTEDVIEAMGIDKSREYLAKAELVLFLLDAETGITEEDIAIADELSEKKVILVTNKTDSAPTPDCSQLNLAAPVIAISAKKGAGLEQLSDAILRLFNLGKLSQDNTPVVTNLRHKQSLAHAARYLTDAITAIDNQIPPDLVVIDLTNAVTALGEITGQTVSEETVDKIFSRFCLGK